MIRNLLRPLFILLICVISINGVTQKIHIPEKFFSLIDSVVAHKNDPENKSALSFLDQAEAQLGENSDNFYQAQIENLRGSVYFNSANYDNGGWYYLKAEALLVDYSDSVEYIMNKYNLGNYHMMSFKYNSALQKYFTCIKSIRKQSFLPDQTSENKLLLRKLEASCMESIGTIFLLIHKEDEAIRYYIRALDTFEDINDDVQISHCFINIGEAYLNLGKYDLALSYLNKGNQITVDLGREQDRGLNEQLYGRIYLAQRQLDSALHHFEASETISLEYSRDYNYFETRIYHGKTYLEMNQPETAEQMIRAAVEFFSEKDVPKKKADALVVLSEIEMREGNWEQAFEHLSQADQTKDEIVREAETNMANEMVSFIVDERREFYDSILILEHDLELQNHAIQLQKKTYANRLLVFTLIFMGAALIAVLIFLRRRKRTNRLLNQALDDNKVLFQEVHHRVKNNFQIISSLLNLQMGQADSEKSVEQLEQLRSRILSMSFVHELLYKTDNANEIEFTPYVDELMNSILSTYAQEGTPIGYRIESKNHLFSLETSIPLGLILNEAITNAAKYAFDEHTETPMITIGLSYEMGEFHLTISDNGKGISPEKKIEEAESLGLELIDILSNQLEGRFEVESGKGTIVHVWFKVK